MLDAPDRLTADTGTEGEFLLCHLLCAPERTNVVLERGGTGHYHAPAPRVLEEGMHGEDGT